jgi:hypothetical protein
VYGELMNDSNGKAKSGDRQKIDKGENRREWRMEKWGIE